MFFKFVIEIRNSMGVLLLLKLACLLLWKKIGYYIFNGCSSLYKIGISTIENYPRIYFQKLFFLTTIKILNSVTDISAGFIFGTSVSEVEIPNTVTKIDSYAFSSC